MKHRHFPPAELYDDVMARRERRRREAVEPLTSLLGIPIPPLYIGKRSGRRARLRRRA